MLDALKFKTEQCYHVYIPLTCTNTVLWGDSNTGKSYIFKDLKILACNRKLPFHCVCIDRSNSSTVIDILSHEVNGLIVIDDFDIIYEAYPEIKSPINTVRNQVLIIGRKVSGIRVNRDFCFELFRMDKNIGVVQTFGNKIFIGK